MREIASRAAGVRPAVAIVVAATVITGIAAQAAGAASTTEPPTISTQYTPTEIGVGQSTGVTYTITDPNSSGSLAEISFTDTLPQVGAVDNPASVSNSGCGSAIAVQADPGSGSISATGITVKAGTPCTISVAVIGNTAGSGADSYGASEYSTSSSGSPTVLPAGNETPASLQVLGAPAIAVNVPKNNAAYNYGQIVRAGYSCTAASGDEQSELSCSAVDDLGNSINSGQPLDTRAPGVHQLMIAAISGVTGDTTNDLVDYTVLPDNRFTISHLAPRARGVLRFDLAVPGAGTLVVVESAGGKRIYQYRLTVSGKRTRTVTLPASSAKKVSLKLTYKPKGGVARTLTKGGIALR